MKIAIAGAGLAGCTLAERAVAAGHDVTVFEATDCIGGLCADGYDDEGCRVQWFGPHIYHTDDERVHEYLSRFTMWTPYAHEVVADVYGKYVPVPINPVTLSRLGCDAEEAARLLYENYSRKMWGRHYDEIAGRVLARVPPRTTNEGHYFPRQRYQGLPLLGWSAVMERMLMGAEVVLNCRAEIGIASVFDRVFWTGRLDRLFGWDAGVLDFRTMDFRWRHREIGQPFPVINLPDPEDQALRVTDYRLLLGQPHHPLAAVGLEIPMDCAPDGRPTHVVQTERNMATWRGYLERATAIGNVVPVGRFAQMAYLDIADTVTTALDIAAGFFS